MFRSAAAQIRPEGAPILPALGNAQGTRTQRDRATAQRANSSPVGPARQACSYTQVAAGTRPVGTLDNSPAVYGWVNGKDGASQVP